MTDGSVNGGMILAKREFLKALTASDPRAEPALAAVDAFIEDAGYYPQTVLPGTYYPYSLFVLVSRTIAKHLFDGDLDAFAEALGVHGARQTFEAVDSVYRTFEGKGGFLRFLRFMKSNVSIHKNWYRDSRMVPRVDESGLACALERRSTYRISPWDYKVGEVFYRVAVAFMGLEGATCQTREVSDAEGIPTGVDFLLEWQAPRFDFSKAGLL